jgi:hypothetical protein
LSEDGHSSSNMSAGRGSLMNLTIAGIPVVTAAPDSVREPAGAQAPALVKGGSS